ncbi:hypothetical protein ACFOHS_23100 [Jhaorihella thermophila]
MTDPDRSSPDRTAAPDTVETLQARVEALYLESRTLHREVRRLQAVQPVLGLRPRTPSPVMRLAMRLMPGLRRRHHLRMIRESGLFDGDWYLAAYPDVAAAGLDPAVHFLLHGAEERRNPGAAFRHGPLSGPLPGHRRKRPESAGALLAGGLGRGALDPARNASPQCRGGGR